MRLIRAKSRTEHDPTRLRLCVSTGGWGHEATIAWWSRTSRARWLNESIVASAAPWRPDFLKAVDNSTEIRYKAFKSWDLENYRGPAAWVRQARILHLLEFTCHTSAVYVTRASRVFDCALDLPLHTPPRQPVRTKTGAASRGWDRFRNVHRDKRRRFRPWPD